MKHVIDLCDTAISKKLYLSKLPCGSFVPNWLYTAEFWCFNAEVKQMSTVTEVPYILCLLGSFHCYEG